MKIEGLKIKGVTCNSKEVKKDFLFVAIKGNRQDGNKFINEAVRKGASVIAAEKIPSITIPKKVKLLKVNNCRKFLAEIALKFYKSPADRIRVVGITGTNGKTTISYLIEALLKESGNDCGVVGTINYRFGGKVVASKNTTPGPLALQALLAKMHAQKIKYCVMEVSSHALDQDRVAGVKFRSAIFTNLTQDHLDYHKNLENYFLAKSKLFSALPSCAIAIINNDDKYSGRIKKLTKAKIITYGMEKEATVMANDIKFGLQSTEFNLIAPKINIRLKTNLAGCYNIYNILASVCWALSEGISIKDIKRAIEKFKNVPGRLESINSRKGYSIFVDYAHTPDALFNVISALRPLVKGKIIVVFGCGGERDKLKRPKMGKIVTELADFAIITNDNPRSENPASIIKEILTGIKNNNYKIITDRFKAIKTGLDLAKQGDCLLIAGKGHENYQILKNKTLDFSDKEVAKKCLALMK